MKKADFNKAVALTTATSEPVFVSKTRFVSYYIAAKRPNDSYSAIQREGDNGVWLQRLKFTHEASGVSIDLVGGVELFRLNQIDLFGVGYDQVLEKLAVQKEKHRIAREQQRIVENKRHYRRVRDERIVAELLPSVKELLASTGVRVSGGYSDEVTVTIKASQLEGFIELLAHSVSE